MGKYNDIWTRVEAYDKADKERKRKNKEEKLKQLEEKKKNELPIQVEDFSLNDEVIEGEAEENNSLGSVIDFRVIKNYKPPLFNPGKPNRDKNGAWKKYKDRFGKYLAFIDSVKYFRSKEYCSILALATTSQVLLNIWGSEKNVSNALHKLEEIGLLSEYNDYYQTGICKQYCYFVEVEKQLIEYCRENNIPKAVIRNRVTLKPKNAEKYKVRCEDIYRKDFKKKVLFKSKLSLKRPKGVKPEQFKSDLYEMLYENYPGFKIYQYMADEINETYYKDQGEFHIRFKPKFHWNENRKRERAKDKTSIVGIGIRATNRLCSAKKDNNGVDSETKRILREEVLTKYGFKFEKDITSSVPRVAYALNHGGWLKDDVDLYDRIY